MEKIFAFLGWPAGQIEAFWAFVAQAKRIFSGDVLAKDICASLLALLQLFNAAAFKTAVDPYGPEVDLTGYVPVVMEEFNGDDYDHDVWFTRGNGSRRGGFNADSQCEVKDGNLVITGEYLDETEGEYGAGWYTGALALNKWYKRGYFEIKCKCNKGPGFWSAFWIQAEHPYDERSKGGVGGAELDIFEAMNADGATKRARDQISHTVWCNGVDDDMEKLDKTYRNVYGKNIYDEYNTYGLLWTEDEYIFYVNGKESFRTSYGLGVSQEAEQVIVSLEIPENLPEEITSNTDYKTEFIVDYVHIYQLPDGQGSVYPLVN